MHPRVARPIAALLLSGAIGGCQPPAAHPAAPVPPPTTATHAPAPAPALELVRGRVLGQDGQPLAAAHAQLVGPDGIVIAQVDVGADGRFALPRARVSGSLASLQIAGVGHITLATVVAVEPRPVELTAYLGTAALPAPLGDVTLVAISPANTIAQSVAMVPQPDGTYAADVASKAATLRYELDGISDDGHTVNGTMATSYAYDGDGDFASIVPVVDGSAHVVFDPRQRLPAAAERVELADPHGTTAQLIQIAALQRAADTAVQRTMTTAHPKTPDQARALVARAFDDFHAGLRALVAAPDPLVRHVAVVAYFGYGDFHAASDDDRALARAAVAELAPEDPLWSLAARAFGNIADASHAETTQPAYVAAFLDHQPSTTAVGTYILHQLSASVAPDVARALIQRLQAERFARTGFPFLAQRLDPDRPLRVGQPMPAFAAHSLDGKTVYSPAAMKGQRYLIEVWATWCHPCVEGMPALHDAFKRFGRQGPHPLHILSISMDDASDAVVAFRTHTWPMPWDQAFPTADEKPALGALFGAAIPFYVLVDERGVVTASSPELEPDDLPALLAAP